MTSLAETTQNRREADLQQQLATANIRCTALAARIRDLEQTRLTAATHRDEVQHLNGDLAATQLELADRRRRIAEAIGLIRRADVDDAGRVAVLLVDLRETLDPDRQTRPEPAPEPDADPVGPASAHAATNGWCGTCHQPAPCPEVALGTDAIPAIARQVA